MGGEGSGQNDNKFHFMGNIELFEWSLSWNGYSSTHAVWFWWHGFTKMAVSSLIIVRFEKFKKLAYSGQQDLPYDHSSRLQQAR